VSTPAPLDAELLRVQRDLITSLLAEAELENDLILGFEVLAEDEWAVRLSGADKEFITVLLELKQRTLQYHSYFMPQPAENREVVYQFLLRQNHALRGVCFSVGPEDAIYLKGEVPATQIEAATLDQIFGLVFEATERAFRWTIQQGFASQLRAGDA
jgi:Putative bacterial sensory transduction regulator